MAMQFEEIYNHIDKIDIVHDILEIGSDRTDGSTPVLAKIARDTNKILYSVDMDPKNISINTEKYKDDPVKFYNLKGEDFLDQNKDLKFSIVLLDNFDWNWDPYNMPDWMEYLISSYKEDFNLEMNNVNSQQAHLLQCLKLTDMFAEQCMVICDDTWWEDKKGIYLGKCGAAIPYLLSLGFV